MSSKTMQRLLGVLLIVSGWSAAGGQCIDWRPPSAFVNGNVTSAVLFEPADPGTDRPLLVIGGSFTTIGATTVNRVAGWDGASWRAFGPGVSGGSTIFSVGSYGPELIVGGQFGVSGGQSMNHIARWDGVVWRNLAGGVTGSNGYVRALAEFEGELIAGGEFTAAGGVPADYIAAWNGTSWRSLGLGVDNFVHVLHADEDRLYVGGEFAQAGGLPAAHVAQWDGQSWQALGAGVGHAGGGLSSVRTLERFEGELVAGGLFTLAGGLPASHIAGWDGAAWRAFGGGMNGIVTSLAVYQPSAGERVQLIAGGAFTLAGTTPVDRVASWDGEAWHALGAGMNGVVSVLASYERDLIAGGFFSQAGGRSAAFLASWQRVHRRADADGDGVIGFSDIDCFVAALIGVEVWAGCGTAVSPADAERHLCVNDLNGDGVVGFDDIDAYVACLIASGCD